MNPGTLLLRSSNLKQIKMEGHKGTRFKMQKTDHLIERSIFNVKHDGTVEPGYSDTGYSGKPGYSGKFFVT